MGKTANLTVRVEPGMKKRASEAAKYLGVSLGSVIETALRSVIAKAVRERSLEAAENQTIEALIERQRYLEEAARAASSIEGIPLTRQQRRASERAQAKGKR